MSFVFHKGSRVAGVDGACFGAVGELALSLLVSLLSSFFFFRLARASSRLATHATAKAVCARLPQVARDKFHLMALRALRVAEQRNVVFFSGVFFPRLCFSSVLWFLFRFLSLVGVSQKATVFRKYLPSIHPCLREKFTYSTVFLLFQTFSLQA